MSSTDFDFLFSTWNVHNRRLRAPLSGSTDWYEFTSRVQEAPLLSGSANLEQYRADDAGGSAIDAIAVRLYNEASDEWSIHWSTAGAGAFLPPTVGRFEDGVGAFFAREEYNGRDIVVRFRWTSQDANAARWEQAFSPRQRPDVGNQLGHGFRSRRYGLK